MAVSGGTSAVGVGSAGPVAGDGSGGGGAGVSGGGGGSAATRLPHGRLSDEAFRLRRALERIRFLLEMEHASLVISIRPPSALSLALQLPGREQTPCHKGTSRELRPNFHVLFKGGAAAASTFSRLRPRYMEWIAGYNRRQKRLTPRGP